MPDKDKLDHYEETVREAMAMFPEMLREDAELKADEWIGFEKALEAERATLPPKPPSVWQVAKQSFKAITEATVSLEKASKDALRNVLTLQVNLANLNTRIAELKIETPTPAMIIPQRKTPKAVRPSALLKMTTKELEAWKRDNAELLNIEADNRKIVLENMEIAERNRSVSVRRLELKTEILKLKAEALSISAAIKSTKSSIGLQKIETAELIELNEKLLSEAINSLASSKMKEIEGEPKTSGFDRFAPKPIDRVIDAIWQMTQIPTDEIKKRIKK